MWIPYLQRVEKIASTRWLIEYNGGELEVDLKKVDTDWVPQDSASNSPAHQIRCHRIL